MKCSLLTLSHYVDDELDDRRRGEMEAHLVGCARCRSGLSHIREEVERIGALAPVRVVDESAHSLLVQLELIEPDDGLPERRTPAADRATPVLPPWMQGHSSASLPWTPERPVRPAPLPPPDEEHMELSGPPAAHRRLSSLDAAAEMPFDLTVLAHDSRVPLMPRSTAGSPVVEVEERKPLEWLPPPVSVQPPPAPADPVPPASAPAPHTAAAPPHIEATREDVVDQPAPSPFDTTAPPASDAGGAPPLAEHKDPPHTPQPPAGDSAVAVWTSDPADAPPGAEYPLTDDDVLAEPLAVERFAGGPAPAPRPTLMDRLRDRLAVRRAISRTVDDTADADIEIVSGTGAPARMRARSDLGRRRAEALRPPIPMGADEMARVRREPGVREMLAPPARPMSAMPVDVLEAPAPPHTTIPATIPVPEPEDGREVSGRPVPPQRRREPVPATSRSGQRVAIAYAAAIALIGAVGIVSGRISRPISQPTPATSETIPVAPPANSSSVGPSGAASSASGSASQPQAPVSLAPSVAPAPVSPVSIGSGGSGWTVQNIRVGDHSTYFRIVFDLGGAAATGEPKVEITYPDAKTIVVTITGASPSAAPPTVGSSSIVTAITTGPGSVGTAVYRITIAKPATGKPLYLSGPLRLVVDVSAG